jgi:hypothetical protein
MILLLYQLSYAAMKGSNRYRMARGGSMRPHCKAGPTVFQISRRGRRRAGANQPRISLSLKGHFTRSEALPKTVRPLRWGAAPKSTVKQD